VYASKPSKQPNEDLKGTETLVGVAKEIDDLCSLAIDAKQPHIIFN